MEPSQSDRRRKRLRKLHEIFANEVVDYFQQYFEFKPNEDKTYSLMTKSTGDAITTISYLFRNETWKMCRDMRDYIVDDENFANYCRVIRVDGGNRFFYNYLRRVSIILEMASFCFMKGKDFFSIARKYMGMYEYRDLQLFEEKGSWAKLFKIAEFIGSCGDRLKMVMVKEEPSKKPESFIDTVVRLTPTYTSQDSNYRECFPYIAEIRWKLVIDDNTRSLENPDRGSSSSDGEDDNPPDASSRAARPKLARLAQERRLEPRDEQRPSTSREQVTTSKEAKSDPRIQIEGDDEKAIIDFLLGCCSRPKKMGHLGESIDSEASNTMSTESEADYVLEYGVVDSSDSDSDEELKKSRLQLVDLKELRKKRASEASGFGQHGNSGTSQSTSGASASEPRCPGGKVPKLSNKPKFGDTVDTDTSEELGTSENITSDETSRSPK